MSLGNNVCASFTLNQDDRLFLDRLRGLSIIRVVLVHLGLSWFYPPYSQFVLVFLPILFFVSGAVSFPVFLRAQNSLHYTVKRLSSVIIPYYVIAAFIVISIFVFSSFQYSLSVKTTLRWLLVSPTSEMTPFPLGQIWFLRALLVISILSIPVYVLCRDNLNYLLAPIVVSIVATYYQTYYDIYHYFYIGYFNLYQPMVHAGFFFLGSFYYAKKRDIGLQTLLILTFGSAAVSAFAFVDAGLALNMAGHSFAPNLYYIGVSFSVIFLTILSKPFIQNAFYRLKRFDWFVLLYGKHAYSVFIIHSGTIYFSKVVFGWTNAMNRPTIALAKMFFVLIGSLFLAIPVTVITRMASKRLVAQFYGE